MNHGMVTRLSFLLLFCGILMLSACYFGFSGEGTYEYEGESGKPERIEETITLAGDTIVVPETLDEEFDLIEADTREDREQGDDYHGQSEAIGDIHKYCRQVWWWCVQELERDYCTFSIALFGGQSCDDSTGASKGHPCLHQ